VQSVDLIKHIAEIVSGVLLILGLAWLKWKHLEWAYSRDDLLEKSETTTLFNIERKRL